MHHQFFGRKRGQTWGALLESRDFMFSLLRASRRLVLLGIVAFAVGALRADAPLPPLGQEYLLAGSFPGDQVFGHVALSAKGGFVVWHDNYVDGDGYGIGARRLDANFTGTLGAFRVNGASSGDQEYPRVALFADGGAVVVLENVQRRAAGRKPRACDRSVRGRNGEPPVVLDTVLTRRGVEQLRLFAFKEGYFEAEVE